jgi:hypothetical protein
MKSSFLYSKFRYFLRWLESMRAPRTKLMAPAASTILSLSCALTARSALASSQRCDRKKVGTSVTSVCNSQATSIAASHVRHSVYQSVSRIARQCYSLLLVVPCGRLPRVLRTEWGAGVCREVGPAAARGANSALAGEGDWIAREQGI